MQVPVRVNHKHGQIPRAVALEEGAKKLPEEQRHLTQRRGVGKDRKGILGR
jgi:hypothetical protein